MGFVGVGVGLAGMGVCLVGVRVGYIKVMGYLNPRFGSLSVNALRHMIGECMALPCVGAILLGIVTTMSELWVPPCPGRVGAAS